jgi:hypothetical protein
MLHDTVRYAKSVKSPTTGLATGVRFVTEKRDFLATVAFRLPPMSTQPSTQQTRIPRGKEKECDVHLSPPVMVGSGTRESLRLLLTFRSGTLIPDFRTRLLNAFLKSPITNRQSERIFFLVLAILCTSLQAVKLPIT